VKGHKASSGVLVHLEGVSGTPPAPKDHAVIRQREKQFDPPVTIVVRGTTVDFPNDDKFFHNVFSVSRPARFDLGLYKSGSTKSVEMKRAGTVDVYCNIHPNMIARVKVLDNGFYTITDGQGRFQIAGVPPGEVAVVAWLPTGDQATGKVTVTARGVVDVTLEVSATVRKESHLRKDGTPYGRYK
jgi:plastocyanin